MRAHVYTSACDDSFVVYPSSQKGACQSGRGGGGRWGSGLLRGLALHHRGGAVRAPLLHCIGTERSLFCFFCSFFFFSNEMIKKTSRISYPLVFSGLRALPVVRTPSEAPSEEEARGRRACVCACRGGSSGRGRKASIRAGRAAWGGCGYPHLHLKVPPGHIYKKKKKTPKKHWFNTKHEHKRTTNETNHENGDICSITPHPHPWPGFPWRRLPTKCFCVPAAKGR